MKNYFILVITKRALLAACFLLSTNAAIASFLPSKLDKKTFLFHVANIKSKSNPNAGTTYTMHFNKNTYAYEIANTKKTITGHYAYKILDSKNSIALITCHEVYDNKKSDYTMLLNAADAKSGLYIYKRLQGTVTQQRMNFAYYTIK